MVATLLARHNGDRAAAAAAEATIASVAHVCSKVEDVMCPVTANARLLLYTAAVVGAMLAATFNVIARVCLNKGFTTCCLAEHNHCAMVLKPLHLHKSLVKICSNVARHSMAQACVHSIIG
jgi:hypothetical protein